MTDSPPESNTPATRPPTDLAGWLIAGIIGVGLLMVAASFAPQRLKLPLLTPLALGAAAGWGLGRFASARQVFVPWLVAAVTWGLIAVGLVAGSFEAYRLGAAEISRELNRRALERDPLADRLDEYLSRQIDEGGEVHDSMRADYERGRERRQAAIERERRLASFAGYLEHRIPAVWGRWPAPWPELFWGAEILLASSLGAFIARRQVVPPADAPQGSTTDCISRK